MFPGTQKARMTGVALLWLEVQCWPEDVRVGRRNPVWLHLQARALRRSCTSPEEWASFLLLGCPEVAPLSHSLQSSLSVHMTLPVGPLHGRGKAGTAARTIHTGLEDPWALIPRTTRS